MQIIRTIEGMGFDALSHGSVVTIGNFDGLHLGHRKLLDRMLEHASVSGLPSVVMCFEPTPEEYFSPQNPPARLMRFSEKCRALEDCGIDLFCCPNFDDNMRNGSPEWFVRDILVEILNVRHLIVGNRFRFGKNRAGTVEFLERAAEEYNFQIDCVPKFESDGTTVSSTVIRRALSSGNLMRASELLGRYYRMTGEVIHGNHLGRKLGYPTANIDPDRICVALRGIFAVQVMGLNAEPLEAVASLGTRPTVGGTKMLLEVHIFDFDEDIYGRQLDVDFIEKIRDEVKFPDVDALIEQMHDDEFRARRILAKTAL